MLEQKAAGVLSLMEPKTLCILMSSFTALGRYPSLPVASGLLRALPSFVPETANAHDLTSVAVFLAAFPHEIYQTVKHVNEGLLKGQELSSDATYFRGVRAQGTRTDEFAVDVKTRKDRGAERVGDRKTLDAIQATGELCLPSAVLPPLSSSCPCPSDSRDAPLQSYTSCFSYRTVSPYVPLCPYPALWNLILLRLPQALTSLSPIAVAGILHATAVTRTRLLPEGCLSGTKVPAFVSSASCVFGSSSLSRLPRESCHKSSLAAGLARSFSAQGECSTKDSRETWLSGVLTRIQLQLLRRVPQALGTARPQQISNIAHDLQLLGFLSPLRTPAYTGGENADVSAGSPELLCSSAGSRPAPHADASALTLGVSWQEGRSTHLEGPAGFRREHADQPRSGQSLPTRSASPSRPAIEHFEGSALLHSPVDMLEQLVTAAAATLSEFSSRDLSVFLSAFARALEELKNAELLSAPYLQVPGRRESSLATKGDSLMGHDSHKDVPRPPSTPSLCSAALGSDVSPASAPPTYPLTHTTLTCEPSKGTTRTTKASSASCTAAQQAQRNGDVRLPVGTRANPSELGIVRAFGRLDGRGALAAALISTLPKATARDLRALASALPRIWAFRDHLEKMRSSQVKATETKETTAGIRRCGEAGDKKNGIKEGRPSFAQRSEDRWVTIRRQQEQAIVHEVLRGIRDRAQELDPRELAALALDIVRLIPFDGEGRGGEEGGLRVQQALTAVCQELYRVVTDWKKEKEDCRDEQQEGRDTQQPFLGAQALSSFLCAMVHAADVAAGDGSCCFSSELRRLLALLLPLLSDELLASVLPASGQTGILGVDQLPWMNKGAHAPSAVELHLLRSLYKRDANDRSVFPSLESHPTDPPAAPQEDEPSKKFLQDWSCNNSLAVIPSPLSLAGIAPPADTEMGPRAVSLCFWALAQLGSRHAAEFGQLLKGAAPHADPDTVETITPHRKASFSSPSPASRLDEEREGSGRPLNELAGNDVGFRPGNGRASENARLSAVASREAVCYRACISNPPAVSSFPFPPELLEWLLVRSIQHMPAFEQLDLLYVAEALCIVSPPTPARVELSSSSLNASPLPLSASCYGPPSALDKKREDSVSELLGANQRSAPVTLQPTESDTRGRTRIPADRRRPDAAETEDGQGVQFSSALPRFQQTRESLAALNQHSQAGPSPRHLLLQSGLLAAVLRATADRLGLPMVTTADGQVPMKSEGDKLKPIVSSEYIDVEGRTGHGKSMLSLCRGAALQAKGGVLKSSWTPSQVSLIISFFCRFSASPSIPFDPPASFYRPLLLHFLFLLPSYRLIDVLTVLRSLLLHSDVTAAVFDLTSLYGSCFQETQPLAKSGQIASQGRNMADDPGLPTLVVPYGQEAEEEAAAIREGPRMFLERFWRHIRWRLPYSNLTAMELVDLSDVLLSLEKLAEKHEQIITRSDSITLRRTAQKSQQALHPAAWRKFLRLGDALYEKLGERSEINGDVSGSRNLLRNRSSGDDIKSDRLQNEWRSNLLTSEGFHHVSGAGHSVPAQALFTRIDLYPSACRLSRRRRGEGVGRMGSAVQRVVLWCRVLDVWGRAGCRDMPFLTFAAESLLKELETDATTHQENVGAVEAVLSQKRKDENHNAKLHPPELSNLQNLKEASCTDVWLTAGCLSELTDAAFALARLGGTTTESHSRLESAANAILNHIFSAVSSSGPEPPGVSDSGKRTVPSEKVATTQQRLPVPEVTEEEDYWETPSQLRSEGVWHAVPETHRNVQKKAEMQASPPELHDNLLSGLSFNKLFRLVAAFVLWNPSNSSHARRTSAVLLCALSARPETNSLVRQSSIIHGIDNQEHRRISSASPMEARVKWRAGDRAEASSNSGVSLLRIFASCCVFAWKLQVEDIRRTVQSQGSRDAEFVSAIQLYIQLLKLLGTSDKQEDWSRQRVKGGRKVRLSSAFEHEHTPSCHNVASDATMFLGSGDQVTKKAQRTAEAELVREAHTWTSRLLRAKATSGGIYCGSWKNPDENRQEVRLGRTTCLEPPGPSYTSTPQWLAGLSSATQEELSSGQNIPDTWPQLPGDLADKGEGTTGMSVKREIEEATEETAECAKTQRLFYFDERAAVFDDTPSDDEGSDIALNSQEFSLSVGGRQERGAAATAVQREGNRCEEKQGETKAFVSSAGKRRHRKSRCFSSIQSNGIPIRRPRVSSVGPLPLALQAGSCLPYGFLDAPSSAAEPCSRARDRRRPSGTRSVRQSFSVGEFTETGRQVLRALQKLSSHFVSPNDKLRLARGIYAPPYVLPLVDQSHQIAFEIGDADCFLRDPDGSEMEWTPWTTLRHRLLQAQGWNVVAIPHFEWTSLPDRLSRLRYLRRKLLRAVSGITGEPASFGARSMQLTSELDALAQGKDSPQSGGAMSAFSSSGAQGLRRAQMRESRGGLPCEMAKQYSLTSKNAPAVWDIFLEVGGEMPGKSRERSDENGG
ncbi:rap domain-containing protein [Cystoisospora suis]|uniref:Rap domain-containing protein n=1 Tax=Cystoisospora suis TaxID=483139 RepID=A0A2C6L4E4_9APIC|nr:rap domain-containing protein [Cystoisospora suis]